MEIALKGHSKFIVSIAYEKDDPIVIKKARTPEDFVRLKSQAIRQTLSHNIHNAFQAPEVIAINEEAMEVIMKYLPYPHPLYCFSDHRTIKNLRRVFGDYFNDLSGPTYHSSFDSKVFNNKLSSVHKKIINNHIIGEDFFVKVDKIIEKAREISCCYHGMEDLRSSCHGDLTFSNIFVDNDSGRVFWIDFIDGWNHSALIDLAKLRQEHKYLWSSRFSNHPIEGEMIDYENLVSDVLDFSVDAVGPRFEKLLFLYSIMNDLRLLQYETSLEWCDKILIKILEDLNQCNY